MEDYPEPCEDGALCKYSWRLKVLTVFAKCIILDIRDGSAYASACYILLFYYNKITSRDFQKKIEQKRKESKT